MKKYLFIVLALLLMVGVANATNIPVVFDPKNAPVVWTEQVYNGSGADIASGYGVQWDFNTSDSADNAYDDLCPWVTVESGVDNLWTAGVVPYGKNIINGAAGSIVVKGPTYVLKYSTPPVVNQVAGLNGGKVTDHTGGANTAQLGVCILASQASTLIDDGATTWSPIYIDVVHESD